MDLPIIDMIVFLVYMLTIVLFGISFSFKKRTTEPEGPGQVFEIASEAHKFSLGSFRVNFAESTFWLILIYGLFINLQNFGIDQSYIQRYISAKNDKEAVSSTLLGSLLYIPVSLLFFLIGTALYSYYQAMPNLSPVELQGMENADKIFPYFIVSALPTGVTGLLIASIFAAGMSTISTSINSSATVILTDHFKRYINKEPSYKTAMHVLFLASFFMGGIGIAVGVALTGVKSALDAWWALSSIFSGGILGLFLLGLISKKVESKYAAIGVICGVLVIGWMSLSPLFFEGSRSAYKSPFHTNLTIVLGTMTILLVGFALTILMGNKRNRNLS